MGESLGNLLMARARPRLDTSRDDVDRWPSARWRASPVDFAREVLGTEPWSREIDVLEAVRDHPRVAVAAGHKVSKSHAIGILALWFYCSFDDARVVMSSTTARQVDEILWRELRMMHARAIRPIDGVPSQLARSGLKSNDFREVVGFTAREGEAVAGVSGKNLLYLIDEASGVPDHIFEAIEGNRAGGARIALFSNPTRTEGEHYAAFSKKAEFYKTLRISSEESPNVIEGREVIPGLAGRAWVEEKKREWGETSPLYRIRVKGEHVVGEDGKIVTIHMIAEAEKRWPTALGVGRLQIGLDPAGPGGAGDESVFAPRRGAKIRSFLAMRGLTEEGHLVQLLGILKEEREALARRRMVEPAIPVVVLDREGLVGHRVYSVLDDYAESNPGSFELIGVRSSDRARREPIVYDRVRDELWGNLANWLRPAELGGGDGAIPEDARLAKELHAPKWEQQLSGRLKATDKRELKKQLGHSPDRADAAALAAWPVDDYTEQHVTTATEEAREREDAHESDGPGGMDPYAAVDFWGRRS